MYSFIYKSWYSTAFRSIRPARKAGVRFTARIFFKILLFISSTKNCFSTSSNGIFRNSLVPNKSRLRMIAVEASLVFVVGFVEEDEEDGVLLRSFRRLATISCTDSLARFWRFLRASRARSASLSSVDSVARKLRILSAFFWRFSSEVRRWDTSKLS